ncbi:MAG: hypothetical protein D6820_00590, partial [Lentisphaerae bacterium]
LHPRLHAEGMAAIYLGLWFLAIACWLLGKALNPMNSKLTSRIEGSLALIFVILGCWIAFMAPDLFKSDIRWQPFSPEVLQQMRAAGKAVFIDFEASWCTSCKTNKLAFTKAVKEAFRKHDVVMLKADFSNYDPVVGEWLKRFGRRSVPLYVYYPPGKNREPEILPEILTPGILLSLFESSSKN